MSTKWPFPVEVASKSENVKLEKRIPILKNPRFFELVAKFGDFPWAQDSVIAAHQLENVVISCLYQTLEIALGLSPLFLFLLPLAFAILMSPFPVPT